MNYSIDLVLDYLCVQVLDFGCGTGETTAAMSQGQLGDLGQPGRTNRYPLVINGHNLLLQWLYSVQYGLWTHDPVLGTFLVSC